MKNINFTGAAVRNHEELFQTTNPLYKKPIRSSSSSSHNWAFDEVIRRSRLDTKTRVMMILASTIGSQAIGEYKVMVNAALNVGVTPVVITQLPP